MRMSSHSSTITNFGATTSHGEHHAGPVMPSALAAPSTPGYVEREGEEKEPAGVVGIDSSLLQVF